MTDTLYLRLEVPDAAASVEGQRVTADGAALEGPLRGTLGELLAAQRGARLVVLIPAGDALTTSAHLPKISVSKLRHSLPFALEEQLATDLEGQHFALGPPREVQAPDGTPALDVPTTVIARARLGAWLEMLRAAGAEPTAIHLAEDCIAAKPGDVVAWVKNERELFLRAPSGQGLASDIDTLALSLDLLLGDPARQTLGLQAHIPPDITDSMRAAITAKLERGGLSLSRVTATASHAATIAWLVAQLRFAEPINLLQGDFAPRRTASAASGRWRLAAAMTATLLMLHFVDRVMTLRAASASERQVDAVLLQAAQVAAPALRSSDALLRVVGGSSAEPQGAALLQAVLNDLVVAGLTANSLKSISLDGKVLRIEVLPVGAVEPVIVAMRSRGWQIESLAGDDGAMSLTLARVGAGARP